AVDEAHRQGLVRAQHAIREEQLIRRRMREHFAPARRAAEAGHDAEARARMREAGARRRETEVECENKIERAAETVAVDQRDGETRQALDLREDLLPEGRELVRLERLNHAISAMSAPAAKIPGRPDEITNTAQPRNCATAEPSARSAMVDSRF